MKPIQNLFRICAVALFAVLFVGCAPKPNYSDNPEINRKVAELLSKMTLEEKIGQMNQYSGNEFTTGPQTDDTTVIKQIEKGQLGSMLNIVGAEKTRSYQEAALKSRLGIPLLFGLDVIHGFRTTFPIPLGEAASFDLAAIENGARCAAVEASAAGVHWTFAPMVDISRDARWGRVMEGAGEDPYYGALVAAARIKGFQGNDLEADNTIMACIKHFAAYGAPTAGIDYNTVDMSWGEFYNYYMPPYKAGAEAGVATFMNAFNDFNNVPCSGNTELVVDLLKGKWGFKGFVVSDWGSIGEMIPHGYAADKYDAAVKASSTSDMDMESRCYIEELANAVRDGKVKESVIDDAVARILTKKFEIGIFDDPFKYCNKEREDNLTLTAQTKNSARDMAKRSIVMLKNDNTLPLNKNIKSVAVIGALNDSKFDMKGNWAWPGDVESVVTVRKAFEDRGYKVNYAEGYSLETLKPTNVNEAIAAARNSDVVVVAIGERAMHSGEAYSKVELTISDEQQNLVAQLAKTGKPVITLVMGGRPLIFKEATENSGAVAMTWWLGSEAGNAICDVLFGDYNPSAKLPMTFPKRTGQSPICYNAKRSGRPSMLHYIDDDAKPAYAFGYGLSYSTFEIKDSKTSTQTIKGGEGVEVAFTLLNSGKVDGEEVVQVYVCDKVSSVTRPWKELKGYAKIELKAGQSSSSTIKLAPEAFGFYTNDGDFIYEKGEFDIFIGNSSDNLILVSTVTMK